VRQRVRGGADVHDRAVRRGHRLSNSEPVVRWRMLRGPHVRGDSVRVLLLDEPLRRRGSSVLLRLALRRGAHLRSVVEPGLQPTAVVRRRDVQRDRDVLELRGRLRVRCGLDVHGRDVRRVPSDEPDVQRDVLRGAHVRGHSVRVLLLDQRVRRPFAAVLLRLAMQRGVHVRTVEQPRVQRGAFVRRRDVQRERDVLELRERLPLQRVADLLERRVRDVQDREPNVHRKLLHGPALQRDAVRLLLLERRLRRIGPAVLLQRAVQRGAQLRRLGEPRVPVNSGYSQKTLDFRW
jgi:hypothetical protein